ncbi:hypothetical protein [Pontiella sp.]|uniref:hypothetical protein n=1 Tax=Pontiella sp. TaxID=2837462 RepID=UPI00356A1832
MNWSEQPFVAYLKAVDDTLDAFYGSASDPDDFETLADAHQRNVPPETAALRLRTTGARGAG